MGKGKIHIKEKNEGKFGEWAKRHGMGVQEAARHVLAHKDRYSGAVVKQANFARNAAKWKHEDGGEVRRMQFGGFGGDPMQMRASLAARYGADWEKRAGADELQRLREVEAMARKGFMRMLEAQQRSAAEVEVKKAEEENRKKREALRPAVRDARRQLDSLQKVNDSLMTTGLHPFQLLSNRQKAGQLAAYLAEHEPELAKDEIAKAQLTGKGMMLAGKYVFPGAAPLFNAINNTIDGVELVRNPSDTLNWVQVGTDGMSQWQSPRTRARPFGLMGDALSAYDIYKEARQYADGGVSMEGYKADSPDRFNDFNIIPSNNITMHNVPHPVMGIDNTGMTRVMYPGWNYRFPGQSVFEVPIRKYGGVQYGSRNRRYNGPASFQKGGTAAAINYVPTNVPPLPGAEAEQTYVSPGDSDLKRLVFLTDIANNLIASGTNQPLRQYGVEKNPIITGNIPGSEAPVSKVFDSIYIFNQRPDVKNLSPEQRINMFYNSLYSSDKDVQAFKSKVKTLGYGTTDFFRNSPNVLTQAMLGEPRLKEFQAHSKPASNAVPYNVAGSYQPGGEVVDDGTGFIGAGNVNPFYANPFMSEGNFTDPQNATRSNRELVGRPLNMPLAPIPGYTPATSVASRYPTLTPPPTPEWMRPQPATKTQWGPNVRGANRFLGDMAFFNHLLKNKQRNQYKDAVRIRNLGDNKGPLVHADQDDVHGDYTPDGFFRPDQTTPVFYGAAQDGGFFSEPLRQVLPVAPPALPDLPMERAAAAPAPDEVSAAPATPAAGSEEGTDFRSMGKDVATRTNNPGNMKWHSWMERFGGYNSKIKGTDGGTFAAFPTIEAGLQAYQTQLFGDVDGVFKSRHYKASTPVDKALRTWSNDGYGAEIYPAVQHKTLGDLTPEERQELTKRQIKAESGKMYKLLHEAGVMRAGGEYVVTPRQLQYILAHGGEVEFL